MPPFDIIRPPDQAVALGERRRVSLAQVSAGRFAGGGLELDTEPRNGALALRLRAAVPLGHLWLRWAERLPEGLRYLGDAWDQRQGSLEWRCLAPERSLPWHFLAFDGQHTHGVGVETGAAALCQWQVDPYGVTLWLDVRNGGAPVELGDRELRLANVAVRPGKVWEAPFQAARRFASRLAVAPLSPKQPVYGFCCSRPSETWDPRSALSKARLLADLSENTVNRPFLVVPGGRQQGDADGGAVGMHATAEVGDLGALAQAIAETTCRPGLRLRPLLSMDPERQAWALPAEREGRPHAGWALDPTHPGVMDLIERDVHRAVAWGYELLRHDLASPDLLGGRAAWTDACAEAGWRFHNPRLTTAEALRDLYSLIRRAADGRALIAASNAVGHLATGQVHIQRISSDSGTVGGWGPVRISGVNALAFRGFHHGALYAVETDPVTLSPEVPWALSEQWLRLLSASGVTCFVAPSADLPTQAQQRALRSAFGKASRPLPLAEPVDWLATTSPGRWKLGNETISLDWFSAGYDEPA